MVNPRNKALKRKSDSFVIENAKAVRLANQPKRIVKIPIATQLKSLQEAYAAVTKENEENVKLIESLKEQVAFLEQRSSPISETESKESQTSSENLDNNACTECIFIGKNEEDLRMHISSNHNLNDPVEKLRFKCNLCGQKSEEKWELMAHRKLRHVTKVKVCKYFIKGACEFTDQDCWFRHENLSTSLAPQTLSVFKCNLCGKTFNNKREFMEHRKREHTKNVSQCRENKSGWCRFASEDCWFLHNNESEKK